MIIICFSLIMLLCLIDYILYKNIFTPTILFSGLFLMIGTLAQLKLYNIKQFPSGVVVLIYIGVISFCFGSLFSRISFKKKINKFEEHNFNLNWKFIYLLTIITTFGSLVSFFYSFIFLLRGGTYLQIRNMILGYSGETPLITNTFIRVMVTYVSGPALVTLIPIAMFYIIRKERKLFKYIVFLNMILNIISSGGRIMIIYSIIQFLTVLSYSKYKFSRKSKRNIILVIIFFMFLVIGLSNLRSSSNFFRSFYGYFAGPVVLLSDWIKFADSSNIQTYGLSFFYPFSYIGNAILNYLNIPSAFLNNVVFWQGLPQDVWMGVFPDQSMNAFATLFYFFYQDFREFGVILYSFVFGIIMSKIYSKAFIERNPKYFIFYLLSIKAIIGSFIIWQFGSTSFFLSFILLSLCLVNFKGKEKVKNDY